MARKDDERFSHPAAVKVQLCRLNGTVGGLFGSPLREHHGGIALRIRRAEWTYSHGEQRTYAKETPLIDVWLSPLQFAELLTTMNQEAGVPATMQVFNGEEVETFITNPGEAEVVKIREEFVQSSADFVERMKKRSAEIRTLLEEKKVPSKVAFAINSLMDNILLEVEGNRPYAVQRFEEALQKLVVQVKANLAAEGYAKAFAPSPEPEPPKLEEG